MTAADLEAAVRLAGLAGPVYWHEVTGSTNADAEELAADGAPAFTVVGAGHQTAGRGRLDRRWRDRPGGSLIVSVVLRPELEASDLGLLPLAAGAAWAEAIRTVAGLDVGCKWPNDLLLGDAKVGGVLASSSVAGGVVRWAVVGSGINLETPDVEGAAGMGTEVDRVALLAHALGWLRDAMALAHDPGAFGGHVTARWSAVSVTLGRRVEATGADDSRREGVAEAVDQAGRLVLATADGPLAVGGDEIVHLR